MPEAIADGWPVIRQALMMSMPSHVPVNETTLSNCFAALLAGAMDAWVLDKVTPEGAEHLGVGTTILSEDTIAGVKFLVVYSVASFGNIPNKAWKFVYEKGAAWARANGCHRILANTSNPRLVRMVKAFGGDVSQTKIELEV